MQEKNGSKPSYHHYHFPGDGSYYALPEGQGSLFEEPVIEEHKNGTGTHKVIARIAIKSEVQPTEEQTQA